MIRDGARTGRGRGSDAGASRRAQRAGGDRRRARSWASSSRSRRARWRRFRVSAGASRSRARPRAGSCSTTTRIIRRKCARRWPRRARRSSGASSRSFSPIATPGCAICSTNFSAPSTTPTCSICCEVYSAGEEPIAEVSSRRLYEALRARGHLDVRYLGDEPDPVARIAADSMRRRFDRDPRRRRCLQDRRSRAAKCSATRARLMSALEQELRARFGARLRTGDAARRAYLVSDRRARRFVRRGRERRRTDALRWRRRIARGVPAFCLGAGTNLLVSDRGMRGLVVQLGEGFDAISSRRREGPRGRGRAVRRAGRGRGRSRPRGTRVRRRYSGHRRRRPGDERGRVRRRNRASGDGWCMVSTEQGQSLALTGDGGQVRLSAHRAAAALRDHAGRFRA